jgi:hypothetical protein
MSLENIFIVEMVACNKKGKNVRLSDCIKCDHMIKKHKTYVECDPDHTRQEYKK